jgi:polysaccharide deacetylase family protein (PEP-CTERM system associated)
VTASADEKLALSIDVEDWFCVRNLRDRIPFSAWETCESRIWVGMEFLLRELGRRKIRATFFILGWIAERYPTLVNQIASEGHEIGSHGFGHHPIDCLTRDEFADDLRRSLRTLRRLTRGPIRGFRAPSFSVTQRTQWALEVMAGEGLEYDSSIFPVRHPDYGIPDFGPHIRKVGGVIEVPMTSYRWGGLRIPISGGGYFRVMPYAATRSLLRRARRAQPVVLYFHPWEFDADQPRQPLPLLKRFRHYHGLGRNRDKFRRLLDDFPMGTVGDLVDRWRRFD